MRQRETTIPRGVFVAHTAGGLVACPTAFSVGHDLFAEERKRPAVTRTRSTALKKKRKKKVEGLRSPEQDGGGGAASTRADANTGVY